MSLKEGKYSVCAFKEYETKHGMIAEEPVQPVYCTTATQAEKKAEEMAATGEYSSIYIEVRAQGQCYWNPGEGASATGKDWVTHFENL